MNLLTKNRILEAGDEYKSGKDWKPVPEKDLGLQIMFSPYTEVRRPSEAPSGKSGDGNVTLVPPPKPKVAPLPEVAPAPLTGDADTKSGAKPEGLPTVISPKAHYDHHGKAPFPKAKPAAEDDELHSSLPGILEIKKILYPNDAKYTKWIGRNGTFRQIGIRVASLPKSGLIRLRPVGKRGIAKNAIMEIPMESVPALIDTLKEYVKTK